MRKAPENCSYLNKSTAGLKHAKKQARRAPASKEDETQLRVTDGVVQAPEFLSHALPLPRPLHTKYVIS